MSILNLPHAYDLVVGDTFELFHRGILKCVEPSFYDLEFRWLTGAQRGTSYRRKFVFTPTEEDVGQRTLLITLRDNTGAPIEEKTVNMRVWSKPQSPKSEYVVLCMGDSGVSPGIWPSELHRRLTGSGGTPNGDALKNIRFIGTNENFGVRHDGYGGWSFKSFTMAGSDKRFMYVYGDFADKNEAEDQHSFYSDDVGGIWKLEAITKNRIKLIRTAHGGTLPEAPGVLHHASGGTNHADIVYTEAKIAESNPFWDVELGRNNFRAYAERMGVDHIDELLIMLGANSTYMTEYAYKQLVRDFLDGFLAEFPDCRITLTGIIAVGRDGAGHNYGIGFKWCEKMDFIFNLDKWYHDISQEPAYRGKVELLSILGQFDSDYNLQMQDLPVNVRSAITKTINTNAFHASPEGYLQMADAYYRRVVSHLQGD